MVCLNKEEKRKDAHDRAAILKSLGNELKSDNKSLIGNKGFRRFLKTERGSRFAIDEKLLASDERYDGLFVLRTDPDHDAETTANVYKTLWMVEDTFRTAKSFIFRSTRCGDALPAIRAAGAGLPPTIREAASSQPENVGPQP